jgi:TonB family protein
MSTTQIPPKDVGPTTPPTTTDAGDLYEASHWESAYRLFDVDDFPHLVIQLQDDLSRSRRREALWLSLILHLTIIILIVNGPTLLRLMPRHNVAMVAPLSQDKELTYLELPPDAQKLAQPPKKTDIISDKNRIATSKSPQLDAKELKKILDASRAGTPGQSVAPQPGQAPAAPQNQGQQAQQQQPSGPQTQQQTQNNIAKLQAPPVGKPQPQVNFGTSMSAGSAIEQAARAALQNRGGSYGGDGGNYGLGQGRSGSQVLGPAEVLSDTMGVDFGPYLQRVVDNVRRNWYAIIPPAAMPPIMKQGKLAIEFAILKDGSVAGQRIVAGSGDVALDRAAWGGISSSNPFPPLPTEFGGKYLALRFYFFYNIDKSEIH